MAWTDIRAAIVARLELVSITSPVAQTVKKVYATPPPAIQDLPCFIIYPPRAVIARGAGGRTKLYTVRCRLLVKDADLDRAADLADAYREAAIDAFDADVVLFNGALAGQDCEEAAGFLYGGVNYTGFDCLLSITGVEGNTFT